MLNDMFSSQFRKRHLIVVKVKGDDNIPRQ
jgi:hypothetical protein